MEKQELDKKIEAKDTQIEAKKKEIIDAIFENVDNIAEEEKQNYVVSNLVEKLGISEAEAKAIAGENGITFEDAEEEEVKRPHRYGKSTVAEKFNEYEERYTEKLDSAREEYVEKYNENLKEKSGFKKGLLKIGNWLGVNSKDMSINKSEDVKESYDKYRLSLTREEYVNDRLNERAQQMLESGKTEEEVNEYISKISHRYGTFITKASKLEEEYKNVSEVKRSIWGESKSKNLEKINGLGKKFWENKIVKSTIGNKWVRFALTTGTVGALSGGFSGLFLINRSARFLGGMVGGRIAKWSADKIANEEKILSNKLAKLEERYHRGSESEKGQKWVERPSDGTLYKTKDKSVGINSEEYIQEREKIEQSLNRIRRIKDAAVIGGAYAGGMGAGKLSETYNPLDSDGKMSGGGGNHSGNEGGGDNPTSTDTPETTNNPDVHKIHEGAHIGKGEGQEHAFRRIIEDDQKIAKALGYEEWSQKHGLPLDYSEEHLHKFSAGAAHRFAISEGLYDQATGEERWIYENGHDVAYDMQVEADGSVTVHEYVDNIETDVPDSANDSFETDTDYANDGKGGKFIYEKTHGGHHPHHGSGKLQSKIESVPYNDDIKIKFTPDAIEPVPYDDDPTNIIKKVDGVDTKIPKVDGALESTIPKVDGPNGQVIPETKAISGQSSNYDYVQRPGIFNNVEVDPYDQGVNTHRGPGTRYGVYGNQPRPQGGGFLGDLLKIFGL